MKTQGRTGIRKEKRIMMVGNASSIVTHGSAIATAVVIMALHATIIAPTSAAEDMAVVVVQDESIMESSRTNSGGGGRHRRRRTDQLRRPHQEEEERGDDRTELPQQQLLHDENGNDGRSDHAINEILFLHHNHHDDAECLHRSWHVDLTSTTNNIMACTNSLQYPSSWEENVSIYEAVMFDSSDECCDALMDTTGGDSYHEECLVIDDCTAGPPTTIYLEGDDKTSTTRTTPKSQQQRHLAPCGNSNNWHPETKSGNQDGCSNDNHYPQDWIANAGLKDKMFHPSSTACCDMFFVGFGLPCEVYDACAAEDGGGGADGPAAGGPTSGSSKCAWHADMASQDGCTNDDAYPPEWLDPMTKMHMFHPSAQACCNAIFPKGAPCETYDRGCSTIVSLGDDGVEPPPSPTPVTNADCVVPGWHADMGGAKDGCTNDDNIPTDWLKSDMRDAMFFSSSQKCCDFFFKSNCQVYDRGCRIDSSLLDGPCDGDIWHPDKERKTGCTNTANYPKEWNGNKDMEFGTAMACCMKYNVGGQCAVRDGCTNEVVYLEVTKKPTPAPTNYPTKKPTRNPTKFPTPPPSTSPTVRPPAYYIVHGVGTCVNDKLVPKPYYIKETFSDILVCCHFSWAKEKCMTALQEEDGYSAPPRVTLVPTPVPSTPGPVPDSVVEITVRGELQIDYLAVPKINSKDWPVLKSVLIKSIYSVMTKSPICHPGLSVTLSMFGGRSFPLRNRRQLGKKDSKNSEFENDNDPIIDASLKSRMERRAASISQSLQFEMTIPARCDDECQSARGHPGQLAFDDIESHFQEYIEAGVLSSTLAIIGVASDLFDEGDEAPNVSSGTLTYRYGVASSVTWVPTFMPTIAMPTTTPTLFPTENPTEERIVTMPPTPNSDEPSSSPTTACSNFQWHYQGDGECTNSPNYPKLWDIQPIIGSHFLFDTLEDCCFAKSPEWCIVTDTCDMNSVPTLYCNARDNMMYRPTTPSERTCTNSEDYPSAWDNQSDRFLFVSAQDCCAAYYSDGLCFVKNVC